MEILNVEKTASRGIVVTKAYKYEEVDLYPSKKEILENEIEQEIQKFMLAKDTVVQDLSKQAEINQVFEAHIEIAEDFTLQEGIISKIKS